MSNNLSEEIDFLLERYLHLLHQYTTLRSELTSAQSSIHQHIARANFSTDRGGIRYGEDLYDDRMKASLLCRIITTTPTSTTTCTTTPEKKNTTTTIPTSSSSSHFTIVPSKEAEDPKKDPIRMFGILTPQPLRLAQTQAREVVQDMVPRIATVDAEMKDLEIRIRRARKYRAKAEAVQEKEKEKVAREQERALADADASRTGGVDLVGAVDISF